KFGLANWIGGLRKAARIKSHVFAILQHLFYALYRSVSKLSFTVQVAQRVRFWHSDEGVEQVNRLGGRGQRSRDQARRAAFIDADLASIAPELRRVFQPLV